MLKFKGHLYREAVASGETYPEALAYVHAGGIKVVDRRERAELQ